MIIGNVHGRSVSINGAILDPKLSQKIYNHSPDGFSWGYAGSGPSQLALALLLHFSDSRKYAIEHYQAFKFDVIAKLPMYQSFNIKNEVIHEWIKKNS